MATKTVKTKEVAERYIAAVGSSQDGRGSGAYHPDCTDEKDMTLVVNGRDAKEYFALAAYMTNAFSPLQVAGMNGKFSVSVLAQGGGVHGQSDATKLGVARALIKFDINLRAILKAHKAFDSRLSFGGTQEAGSQEGPSCTTVVEALTDSCMKEIKPRLLGAFRLGGWGIKKEPKVWLWVQKHVFASFEPC
jgi:small subunit ribosomal protein S9